jgi:hypothetical protein
VCHAYEFMAFLGLVHRSGGRSTRHTRPTRVAHSLPVEPTTSTPSACRGSSSRGCCRRSNQRRASSRVTNAPHPRGRIGGCIEEGRRTMRTRLVVFLYLLVGPRLAHGPLAIPVGAYAGETG